MGRSMQPVIIGDGGGYRMKGVSGNDKVKPDGVTGTLQQPPY